MDGWRSCCPAYTTNSWGRKYRSTILYVFLSLSGLLYVASLLKTTRMATTCTNVKTAGIIANSQQPKVYIELRGRLGNLLFQVASLLGLALTYNHTPLVYYPSSQIQNLMEGFPKLNIGCVSKQEWIEIEKNTRKITESSHGTKQGHGTYIASLPADDDVIICCYVQAKEHFMKHKQVILERLRFSDDVRNKAAQQLMGIKYRKQTLENGTATGATTKAAPNGSMAEHTREIHVTYVGIHVRRGDMASMDPYKDGYRLPNMTYYQSAMRYFEHQFDHVVFVVCSNGADWVRKNFPTNNVYISAGNNAVEDLALLAACNHTIISTGSYSWWAGFLSLGQTICFRDSIEPDSPLGRRAIIDGRLLSEWIPLTQNEAENRHILHTRGTFGHMLKKRKGS